VSCAGRLFQRLAAETGKAVWLNSINSNFKEKTRYSTGAGCHTYRGMN